jgi:hypothetical protein
MRHWLAVLGCAIAIGGCQTPAPEPTDPDSHTVVHPGDAAVSVVGTPFYLVFKSVACVASVAISAPLAGLAALSESPFAPEVKGSGCWRTLASRAPALAMGNHGRVGSRA